MRAAKRTSNASTISHTPTKMITPVMSLAPINNPLSSAAYCEFAVKIAEARLNICVNPFKKKPGTRPG